MASQPFHEEEEKVSVSLLQSWAHVYEEWVTAKRGYFGDARLKIQFENLLYTAWMTHQLAPVLKKMQQRWEQETNVSVITAAWQQLLHVEEEEAKWTIKFHITDTTVHDRLVATREAAERALQAIYLHQVRQLFTTPWSTSTVDDLTCATESRIFFC